MKRLIIVTLLLVGVMLIGALAENGDSGKTAISWEVNGCWVRLTVHPDVYLGTFTGPDQTLESTGNELMLVTNCPNGYVLDVQATDAKTPPAFTGDILEDFEWKVERAWGNVDEYQGDYTRFPGFNQRLKVGVADKPGEAHYSMAYRYTSDSEDVPGSYSITLVYTATSQ